MQWRNTLERYGSVAGFFHWIIVAGIIAQYFLAEAGEESEAGAAGAFNAMSLHQSIGWTILVLALLRLLWRFSGPRPAWPVTMKRYEIILARLVHGAFYLLLFALALSGWMLSSAEGAALRWFNLFDFPALTSPATEDTLEEIHELLFNVLFGLALLHAAAALKHHFINRDHVLRSMLPRRH